MTKLNFGLSRPEGPPEAADPPSLLWTFTLIAAISAMAFTAVWVIITVLT
jgi:hypothetical protein